MIHTDGMFKTNILTTQHIVVTQDNLHARLIPHDVAAYKHM